VNVDRPTIFLHFNSLSRQISSSQSRHIVVSWSLCRDTKHFLYTPKIAFYSTVTIAACSIHRLLIWTV